ncbi:MAG: zf-HC2 domain-containing protein [Candidatus Latescibacterota bacterium]|nr:MAG: zf-HC2 domain-containing protein [Candidatus Latescibacterota bacterium]
MVCERFQTEGMRLLDGELGAEEKTVYEEHVKTCDDCKQELKEIGRLVELTNDLRLRTPDEEFWTRYWDSLLHRMERGTGFVLMITGIVAVLLFAIYKAVTSPEFLTFKGLSIAVVLLGLVVIFLSVVRERYHENKSDPYKGVKQ